MRFLSTSSDLEAAVSGLLRKCRSVRWAVAWASSNAPAFTLLSKHREKIEQLTIGTHFYQTDPEFISEFLDCPNARFVLNPDGVFHPKVYYFELATGRWACIVGSPNFTAGAFRANAEAALLITDSDSNSEEVRSEVLAALDSYGSLASSVAPADLDAYRAVWARQQRRLGRLSGTYSSKGSRGKAPRSPLAVPLFRETWSEYFDAVRSDDHHTIEGRLAVMETAAKLFTEHGQFEKIPKAERLGIAGIALKSSRLRWAWFGSMRGSGTFWQAINENNAGISTGLDCIPAKGVVRRSDFEAYVSEFTSSFDRSGIANGTRLLALKRPDYFVCLDSKNRKGLCDAFGIRQDIGLDEYWPMVIERLLDSNWWNSPEPSGALERRIWKCRTAFLDVRFYDPS